MVYPLTKIFIFTILKLFIKDIKGVKNLPKNGAFIVAANHAGTIDGALIFYLLTTALNRKFHSFMTPEHFSNFFTKFLFKNIYQCIKINGSLKFGLDYLKRGEIVGIFPEGERTRTGRIKKVERTGLGVMALLTKAPVVPVGIKGSYEFWPFGRKFFKIKRILQLNVGKPTRFNKKLNKKNAREVIRTVMKRIAKLSGQRYPH